MNRDSNTRDVPTAQSSTVKLSNAKTTGTKSFAPNPLIAREWRTRWRDRRSFGLVLVYASLLALLVAWHYDNALFRLSVSSLTESGAAGAGHEYSWTGMARIGREIFLAMSWWQTLGWMVLAPTLTASLLAGERERGLLEGLQLSHLSPWQIVGGKLSAALVFAFALMVATWPITGVCLLMGGVSPQELALSIALQSATALGCATLGLFFSARCRRAGTALRVSLVTITLWCVGSFIAYGVTESGSTGSVWSSLAHIYGKTNPVVAALSIGDPMAMARGLGLGLGNATYSGSIAPSSFAFAPIVLSAIATVAPYVISPLFQLALIPFLLYGATRALYRPFPEQHWIERKPLPDMSTHAGAKDNRTRAATIGTEPWWEIPFARWIHFSNPVLQREVRGKFRMRRVSRAIIIFEIVLAVFVGAFGCWAIWLAIFDPTSRTTIWAILSLTGLVMVMMTAPMIGASAWSHERESGTFEPLMLSLLPSRDIVWGKMAGALLACFAFGLPMYPLLALCVRGVSGTMETRGVSLLQAGATALLVMATAWCYTAIGMLISWRHRRSATAAGWTMSLVLLLNTLVPLVLARLGAIGQGIAPLVQPLAALFKIVAPEISSRTPAAFGLAPIAFHFVAGLVLLLLLLRAMRRRALKTH